MENLDVIITYYLAMIGTVSTVMELLKKRFKWNDLLIKVIGAIVSIGVALVGTFIGLGTFSLTSFVIGSIVLFTSQVGLDMTIIKPLFKPLIDKLKWNDEIEEDSKKLGKK